VQTTGFNAPQAVDIDTKLTVNLVSMFTRLLQPPRTSFFLFGPRGTGKSTWIRTHFAKAHVVNLLATDEMLRYEREPAVFRAEVLALPKERWIVIDEVQRVPRLLDEVHLLMEEHGHRKFALTGSSARKLKRGAANLLAGRAIVRNLLPLTSAETGFAVPTAQLLRYGALPLSVNAADDDSREDFLRAYVTTYLSEEIKAEGLVRDLGGFGRFLEVASLAAGQPTNVSGIARDAGVARDTVRGYFEVLVDTLIAHWLPAYRPRAKIKERALPKLYWFDPGVLHAAAGGFDQPLPPDWDGVLLEHLVLHEIRSHVHYAGIKGSLGYWGTPSGSEVDFVWWRGREVVAIEVKNAREPRRDFRKGIEAFLAGAEARSFVVYRGDRELDLQGTRVLPLETFLRRLHAGQIVG
jgi:predicted AAA+ superfamily ATPase